MAPVPAKPKRSAETPAGAPKKRAPKLGKRAKHAKSADPKRAKRSKHAKHAKHAKRAAEPAEAKEAAPVVADPTGGLITKPPVKRILKKAGCHRISKDVVDEVRAIIHAYTQTVLAATVVFTDHAARKTISPGDLSAGFRANGHHLAMAAAVKKPAPKKPAETKSEEAKGDEAKPKKPSNRLELELPHNNFKKLCKTAVSAPGKEYRFSSSVVQTMQYIVETYLHELAALALKCARHANDRQTVKADDFRLARELRGW